MDEESDPRSVPDPDAAPDALPDPARDPDPAVEDHCSLVADRAEYLAMLAERRMDPRAVRERSGASRATVNRALRALEDADLIARTDGEYGLTAAGRVALERYRAYRRGAAGLVEARELLAELPADAGLDGAMLDGAEVVEAPEGTPYRPVERLHAALAGADRYRAVVPTLGDPRRVRLLYEHVVTDGDPARLVVPPDLRDSLADEFPRRLSAMAADDFELFVGDVPPFGLVLAESGGDRTATVVVHGPDGAVRGLVENGADRAVEWARAEYDRVRADAEAVTDDLRQAPDGGVVGAAPGEGPLPHGTGGPALSVPLERAGFVRLTREVLADRPVADPATAWRAGLDLAEVHTGYAIGRTVDAGSGSDSAPDSAPDSDAGADDGAVDDDGADGPAATDARPAEGDRETLTDRLLAALSAGEDRVVVGPPGSGKSTTCKRVACEWYADDRGPVLYREGGRGGAVGDRAVEDLVATVEAADGHALVVVEDAVRPDTDAVFEAIARLRNGDGGRDGDGSSGDAGDAGGRGADGPAGDGDGGGRGAADGPGGEDGDGPAPEVSFLLDAREREWRDPPGEPSPAAPVPGVETMPALAGGDCERLAERFEATTGVEVDVPVERLRESVRPSGPRDAGAGTIDGDDGGAADGDGEGPTPGEALLVTHRLATYADPLAEDGASSLEADADAVRRAAADRGDRVLDIAVAANLLNAAGLPVDGAVLRVAAGDDGGPPTRSAAGAATESEAADPEPGSTDRGPESTDRESETGPDPETATGAALDVLSGRVLFGTGEDGAYRTVHEAWSVAFLDSLRAAEGEADARRRVGRVADRLLALADDPDLRGRVRRADDRSVVLDALRAAPGEWADDAVESLLALPRERPALAGLFGDADGAAVPVPDACESVDPADVTAWLARAFRGADEYDRAEATYRRLPAGGGDGAGDGDDGDAGDGDGAGEGDGEGAVDGAGNSDGTGAGVAVERSSGLGRTALLRGEFDAAADHAEACLDAAEAADDPVARARALKLRGDVAVQRGEYDVARSDLSAALAAFDAAGATRRVAGCHSGLGYVAERTGEYDRARERYGRSLELARRLGDRRREAQYLLELGTVDYYTEDYDRAVDRFERAVAVATEVGDRHVAAAARNNLGNLERARGNYDRATDLLERSLDDKRAIGDRYGAAGTLSNLGLVADRRGRDDDAESYFRRAMEIERELGDGAGVAKSHSYLGLVARRRGEYDEARRRCERSLEAAREAEDRVTEAEALADLGWVARHRGEYDRARRRYRAALEVATDLDRDRDRAGALCGLGAVARRRGEYDEARERYRRALDALDGAVPESEATALRGLADVDYATGRLDRARERYGRALSLSESADDPRGAVDARVGLGRLAGERGEYGRAREHLDAAREAARDLDEPLPTADCRAALGELARRRGEYDRARDHLDAAREAAGSLSDRREALELARLARLAADRGEYDRAADRARAALSTAPHEAVRAVPTAHEVLGGVAADRGHSGADHDGDRDPAADRDGPSDPAAAREHLTAAREGYDAVGDHRGALDAAARLAAVERAAGDHGAAREHCERALARLDGLPDGAFEDRRAAVEERLDALYALDDGDD